MVTITRGELKRLIIHLPSEIVIISVGIFHIYPHGRKLETKMFSVTKEKMMHTKIPKTEKIRKQRSKKWEK